MKKTETVRNESTRMNSKELNAEALTVVIKHNETGKVLIDEKIGSILFASMIDSDKNGQKFNAGIAGELNLNSLMQSVEAVCDAVAQTLIEVYDIDAEEFLHLMGKVVSSTVSRNFSKEEQTKAVLKGLIDMVTKSKSKKNNGKAH